MKLYSVNDPEFATYGRVLSGYDFTELLDALEKTTPNGPGVIYEPSVKSLEACAVYKDLKDREYGGMPIEIGFCNGVNSKLNCYEYHRDSEINIAGDDAILLVANAWDVVDGKIDSSVTKAFLLKKGEAVEVYPSTLHYAPCSAAKGAPFRVVIVLPYGTNFDAPQIEVKNFEDRLLRAKNKWLIAHPDTEEARTGAYVGITGANIDLFD